MFELTADDIALLNDEDLRSLVERLCESDVKRRGVSPSCLPLRTEAVESCSPTFPTRCRCSLKEEPAESSFRTYRYRDLAGIPLLKARGSRDERTEMETL